MVNVLKAFSILYFGSTGWSALFAVLYIIGLSSIFRKTGTAFWWALIPFARDYRLALCANRKKAGLVILFFRIALTAVNLFMQWGSDQLMIVRFSIPMAAITLVLCLSDNDLQRPDGGILRKTGLGACLAVLQGHHSALLGFL